MVVATRQGLICKPIADIIDQRLVLDIPFGEGKGTFTKDLAGKGNHGTLNGGVSWKLLPSGIWVLDFDGVYDFMDCRNDVSLQITNKLTVELWIRANQPTQSLHYPIAKHPGWALWVDGTGPAYEHAIGIYYNNAVGAEWKDAFPSHLRETWVHLAFTYDNPNSELFVSGISKGIRTDFSDNILTAANLNIGCRTDNAWYFNGLISEVRIYNRALSIAEIKNHFAKGKHLFGL